METIRFLEISWEMRHQLERLSPGGVVGKKSSDLATQSTLGATIVPRKRQCKKGFTLRQSPQSSELPGAQRCFLIEASSD